MKNSPKKPAIALAAATGAIVCLGASSAQAAPVPPPAGNHAPSQAQAVQTTSSTLSSPETSQMGRSRILWCL